MTEEQFRTRVWEMRDAEYLLSSACLEADRAMEQDGYELLSHRLITTRGRELEVRLYERRAPTAEERLEKIIEVGDAVVDLAAGFRLDDPEKRVYRGKLVAAWREAVEKGEAVRKAPSG